MTIEFDAWPADEPAPAARLYHENAKLNASNVGYLSDRIGAFAGDREGVLHSVAAEKTYPSLHRIPFPERRRLPRPRMPLDRILARRRSVRAYSDAPVPFGTIAALLDYAAGETGRLQHPDDPAISQRVRANPSGGGLYPIEMYLVANRVDGLEAGVYHVHALDRCLEPAGDGAAAQKASEHVLAMDSERTAPAVVVLAARWRTVLEKYGERGYRVFLLDAGHLMQNLLLVATALDLGACPVAGFLDDALARALGLDPREEPPVYAMTLGG